MCLHDPLALLSVVEPELVQIEDCPLVVDATGEIRETPGGTVHRVVRDVDAPAAIKSILGLLARGMG